MMEGTHPDIEGNLRGNYREQFDGAWIANGGFDFKTANKAIQDGETNLVSFGRNFVTNDNLVEKYAKGLKINDISHIPQDKVISYYYDGKMGKTGYTDLSVYEQTN